MENIFKLRDLATKKVTVKQAGGIGKVGLIGPDQDPDDFSPLTPYIMVSKHKWRLDFLDSFRGRTKEIELDTLEAAATELGKAVVGSKFLDTALCAQDMPTCAQNQRISPVASFAETLSSADLAVFRGELEHMLKVIDRLDR